MNKIKKMWATAVVLALGTASAFAQNGVTGLNSATTSLKTYVAPVTNVTLVIGGIVGLVGAILTGVFAQKALNSSGSDGALFGNAHQLVVQVVACAVSGLYAAGMTWGILRALKATVGLRVSVDDEREGLDDVLHGEAGYALGTGSLTEDPDAEDAEAHAPAPITASAT